MRSYLELVETILQQGNDRKDRTGIGTRALFGSQLRFDLEKGFPLLTTKKMFLRGIIEELLFFVRGETNTKCLEEKKIHIWKGNTSKEFLRQRGLPYPEGEMGPGYGFQWRNWGGAYTCHSEQTIDTPKIQIEQNGIDQLKEVIASLRTNPTDRRMIVSAWNPSQLSQMALPPCHLLFQFFVAQNRLSCQFYMRSVDVALGLPFNIASYALLTHLVASIVDLAPGELIFIGGDTHLYHSHIDSVKAQLKREPFALSKLVLLNPPRTLQDLHEMSFEDFRIEGYHCHPPLKMPMAV